MAIDSLSLAVVGAQFGNKKGPSRWFAIAVTKPGDLVLLIPEPKNPADVRAVMVQNEAGICMGYITAERCGWVKSQIESGRKYDARFQVATKWGAIIRVAFDGNFADLPPSFVDDDPPAQAEPDWYPDEIPPDDWSA